MSEVLIKDMEMPKNCKRCPLRYTNTGYTFCELTGENLAIETDKRDDACQLIEVPPHGDLIDKEKLYEQTAEWEAQALYKVGSLMYRDDEEGKAEWRRWSAILTERTAFKHDVYDAPVVLKGI